MSNRVTLSTVKSMGFSDRLIMLLLPEPELMDNPYYRRGAKMKLWHLNDVERAMKTKEFISYQQERSKRVEAAKKATKTKTNNLIKFITEEISNIKVEKIPLNKLKDKTLHAKQNWYNQNEEYMFLSGRDGYHRNVYDADEDTINRWMVNYIRHNMTSYDYELYNLAKKTGKGEAYFVLFEGIMRKISETYPELGEECKNQIESKKYIR